MTARVDSQHWAWSQAAPISWARLLPASSKVEIPAAPVDHRRVTDLCFHLAKDLPLTPCKEGPILGPQGWMDPDPPFDAVAGHIVQQRVTSLDQIHCRHGCTLPGPLPAGGFDAWEAAHGWRNSLYHRQLKLDDQMISPALLALPLQVDTPVRRASSKGRTDVWTSSVVEAS